MVEITEESEQLVVRIGGQEFARYRFGEKLWKPYLFPVLAANGQSILQDAPTDHWNHHGFWVGHSRVDQWDFWQERHNFGRIVHRSFERVQSATDVAAFTEVCDWLAPTGAVALTDTRTFTFHDSPPDAHLFDFEILLRAPSQGAASLFPTTEAGLPAVRVAEGISPKTGGALLNSEGGRNEKGTFRQRAAWLDCSGKLGKLECGIAVFDHPANPDSPTGWYARDYGPFAPNSALLQDEPTIIAPRRPLRLRYRVYVHSGDAAAARVAEVWQEYVDSLRQPDSDRGERATEKAAAKAE